MSDEIDPDTVGLRERMNDFQVLARLTSEDDQRPWSVDEIVRDIEHPLTDRQTILNAIDRLRKAGLIHRTQDDLLFPTRAALRMQQINI